MRRNLFKTTAGQTLIEVLIITVLVAAILTAIAGVVAQSLKNTSDTKRQALSTDLAQQGLEVYRNRRQSLGWDTFESSVVSGTYCLNDLPSTDEEFVALEISSCGDETVAGTEFTREAVVDRAADGTDVMVTINVTWLADEVKTTSLTQTFRDIE